MRTILLFCLLASVSAYAQLPSISEKTKAFAAHPGFFDFYVDEANGKIYLKVNRLDTEFLYQPSLPAGLGSNDIGLDRGMGGNTAVVKFTRSGNKLMLVQMNYGFRAITDNAAERRAVEQSFAPSTIWGFTIEAEDGKDVLVDATGFLLRDAMFVSNLLASKKQGNYSIDLTRSAIYLPRTKNFPLNSEFEATITFVTKDPWAENYLTSVAPAHEAITLRMHHSFVQLPDNNYKPRKFDPRAGFYNLSYYDYSTPVSEPIVKDLICRHRLQKKDPSAAKSEAVKPIIYYLDNGTPEPIRSALLEGARWWNQAFEAAGYINAFRVEILPEDADPMDIRYNIINWVHRSTRGWSYGAAVVDPRTGEIIKGNVTLGSLRVRHDYLIAQGLLAPFENGEPVDDKMLAMALQRLKQLSAHEVGHTLGLMHNYISSTQGRASVMDYPAPYATINKEGEIDLSNAYTNEIGEWDKVSINFGYREFPPGTDERTALQKIITDAAGKGLTFISDQDARDPGGLHPAAHLWDVDKDPVDGLKGILNVREKALAKFGLNNIKKDVAVAKLEEVLVPIYLFHRYQLESVVKLVGGMDYTYAVKGDGQMVTRPIGKQMQMRALQAVMLCISPKTLALPESVSDLIPPRPAGYDYNRELFKRRTGLAFDPLAAAEAAANFPLTFLFNPARLNRMIQYQSTSNGLGIDEMLKVLMQNTWDAPRGKGLEGLILQQNEQLVLTHLIGVYLSEQASFATKAAMLKGIEDIKARVNARMKLANADKGYLMMTLERINNKHTAKPFVAEPMPPGAPIGCLE